MPLDLDKLQQFTGITADTNETFEAEFAKRFMSTDQKTWDEETKGKVFGRAIGSITTGIKQIFDEFEVNITGDDLKQPPEAVAKLGISKLRERFETEKSELQKTAGLTADEKIKEATDTITKLQGKNKDLEKLVKTKADEFDVLNKNKADELKKFKLTSTRKDVHSSLEWNPDKDQYSRKGFLADMDEKYLIDLDENDEDFITSRSTGERIKADGTHSTFMSPKDVYKMEGIKAGMVAVNKNVGKQPASAKVNDDTKPKPVVPASSLVHKKVMANTSYQP